jgi:hypothetical protein
VIDNSINPDMKFSSPLAIVLFSLPIVVTTFSCNDTEAKLPVPVKPISSINFYIDNSESNIGYLNGSTEFKSVVDGLVADLAGAKTTAGITYNYISDSIYKLQYNDKEFIDIISNNKITPIALCSEIHQMVDMVAATLDSFDIDIMVSDCILSFCDISDNPSKNKDNAESQLKTSVKTSFKKLRDRGICTSVYAFKSAFTGRYFHYDNSWEKYDRETRPFYIWFFGRKEQLEALNKELAKNKNFHSAAQLHFGFNNVPEHRFNLFFKTGKKGACEISSRDINNIKVSPQNPVQFIMGVNLSNLPAYAQNVDYLKSNVKINFPHLKLTDIQLKKDFNPAITLNKEKQLKENNTHFLYFEIDELFNNQFAEITLENKTDDWYEDWSTMDDKTKERNKEKTFALIHLIDGVRDAFDTHNVPFLKITLPLSKQ